MEGVSGAAFFILPSISNDIAGWPEAALAVSTETLHSDGAALDTDQSLLIAFRFAMGS
jgi:hypothetical protein